MRSLTLAPNPHRPLAPVAAAGPLDCQAERFRLPRTRTWLNCAYSAPLLRDVERAGRLALRRWRAPWRLGPDTFFDEAERARSLFGRLIGAPDGERVALVPSVSYGVALAARNARVRRGANVVIAGGQFPSNVYAWRRACGEVGAELRVVQRPASGESWSQRLAAAIDPRTAVVALGTVDWADGTQFDLETIGRRARDVGAAYVLDGIQSVGALPFDVTRVRPDLLVCSAYKWLLGPMGVGLCYVGERFADGVPLEETWLGRHGSEKFASLTEYTERYQPGARRFDAGGRAHFVLLPMLNVALSTLLEWGPARVQEYCARVSAPARAELAALGCDVGGAETSAHLFGVRLPAGVTAESARDALHARGVHVSVRDGALRVSPNVYNDADDLGALVDALRGVLLRPHPHS
jgi:selenocysteine lyase/cysteine desulfurase